MQFSPYYRIISESDTAVLFIHGIVGTPAHFKDLIPHVPSHWSVYNILLDGHGGSVSDFASTSMEKWKSQVHDQIQSIMCSHKNILLVGHSMGTLLCIRESFEYSSNVIGLYLLNVPLYPRVKIKFIPHAVAAALGKIGTDSPAAMLLSDCSVHLTSKLWKYLSWVPRYLELFAECFAIRKCIHKVAVPCFCVQSAKDELVGRRSFSFLRLCANLTVLELPDSGHFCYIGQDLETVKRSFHDFIFSITD